MHVTCELQQVPVNQLVERVHVPVAVYFHGQPYLVESYCPKATELISLLGARSEVFILNKFGKHKQAALGHEVHIQRTIVVEYEDVLLHVLEVWDQKELAYRLIRGEKVWKLQVED